MKESIVPADGGADVGSDSIDATGDGTDGGGVDAPDAPGDAAPDPPASDAAMDSGPAPVIICPGSWPDASTNGGTDGGVDGGNGDATDTMPSVCGNKVIEPGETCDPPEAPWGGSVPAHTGCTSKCQLLNSCEYQISSGGTSGCYQFVGSDRDNCMALESCIGAGCSDAEGLHLMRCYCDLADDATCRRGAAIGICRREFEVAAGTTDPARIIAALSDAKSPVGAAVSEAMVASPNYPSYCPIGYLGFGPLQGGSYPECGNGFRDPLGSPTENCDPPNGMTCSLVDCKAMTPDPDLLGTTCSNPTSGFAWTIEPTPPALAPELWIVGPGDTWLHTARDFRHWNGVRWSVAAPPWLSGTSYVWMQAPNEPIGDYSHFPLQFPIWSASPTDLWFANGILRRWNGAGGSTWRDMIDMPVSKVLGFTSDDTWAFVELTLVQRAFYISNLNTRAVHWNGQAWLEYPWPIPARGGLRIGAAWGSSAIDIWSFGRFSSNLVGGMAILHWDGSAWRAVNDPCDPTYKAYTPRSAWGSGPRDIWLLARNERPGSATMALWHYDGSKWAASTDLPWTASDTAFIWGSSASNVWAAAGSSGQVAHFDGASWTMSDTGATGISWLGGEGPDTVWAIGTVGSPGAATLLRWHHACADVPRDGGSD